MKWIKWCQFLAFSILDILTIWNGQNDQKWTIQTVPNNNVEFKMSFQKYFQCIDVLFLFDILSLIKLLSVLYILSFALENNRLKSNVLNNTLRLKRK